MVTPRFLVLASLCLGFLTSALAEIDELSGGGWDAPSEEELTATVPKLDEHASSEFTYRKIRVDDEFMFETNFRYHFRAKLFTEAALEDWDKIDIEYFEGMRVTNVRARVIYPDLTVKELDWRDVVKRKVFKNDSFSGYAKSFSFPGLKPGCIIEYKWNMELSAWYKGLTIDLCGDYPTWLLDVEIRPYKSLSNRVATYNIANANWEQKGGVYRMEIQDLRPASEAPFLGPRRDFEAFTVLDYSSEFDALGEEKYWNYRAGRLKEVNTDYIRPKVGKIKTLAADLYALGGSYEDAVKRAYDYCVEEIVNISYPTTEYTEEELEDLDHNESAIETLKHGYGTSFDINALFASLVAAEGFDVSFAEVENHEMCTYTRGKMGGFNLPDLIVAVKIGAQYQYFDPGSKYLPFGQLNARNTDAHGILISGKFYRDIQTPGVEDDFSQTSRVANLSFNEYGDLEGWVFKGYKGHAAVDVCRSFSEFSDSEIEEFILERHWKDRLPRTEVSEISVRNLEDAEKGVIVKYKVRIPGYAAMAGDRIVFNPSVFQEGSKAAFLDEERWEPIGFSYKPFLIDKITFSLPDGYKAEASDGTNMEFGGNLVVRRSMLEEDEEGNLVYQRFYTLNVLKVNGQFYSVVKREFELLNEADHRPVTLSYDEKSLAQAE